MEWPVSMVDCLRDCWLSLQTQFPLTDTLLLYQDNGPENHSRRTQLIKRLTNLADEIQLRAHKFITSRTHPGDYVRSAGNNSFMDP